MQSNTIAVSLLIGFSLVAAAIFFSDYRSNSSQSALADAESVIRTEHRYVYGNSNAPTVIVEFSDFECPYCARLHPTLKKIVDESEGQVAWEYRHLPLPMHPLADEAAVAIECVGKHLGVEAFWKYGQTIFDAGRITEPLLQTEALSAGVSESQYHACQTDESIMSRIEADTAAAAALGGSGTPFNVIVYSDGTIKPVSGALPYEQWIALLN